MARLENTVTPVVHSYTRNYHSHHKTCQKPACPLSKVPLDPADCSSFFPSIFLSRSFRCYCASVSGTGRWALFQDELTVQGAPTPSLTFHFCASLTSLQCHKRHGDGWVTFSGGDVEERSPGVCIGWGKRSKRLWVERAFQNRASNTENNCCQAAWLKSPLRCWYPEISTERCPGIAKSFTGAWLSAVVPGVVAAFQAPATGNPPAAKSLCGSIFWH